MRNYLGEIATDPTAHTWLRNAAREIMNRDLVDAANDAQALLTAIERTIYANTKRDALGIRRNANT